MVWIRQVLLEEPALNWRQWHSSLRLAGRRDGSAVVLRYNCKSGDRRVLKQIASGEAQPGLGSASNDQDALDGVSAGAKEIIVYSDAIQLQNILPDRDQ